MFQCLNRSHVNLLCMINNAAAASSTAHLSYCYAPNSTLQGAITALCHQLPHAFVLTLLFDLYFDRIVYLLILPGPRAFLAIPQFPLQKSDFAR